MPAHLSRRHLLSLGATAAAAAGLAACGASQPTDPNAPVALRFAWWGSTSRHEATKKQIAGFEAANTTIKVSGEPGDFAGYFDKLATQTAAGDAPDVITLGGAYVAEYAQRGALLDLGTVKAELDLASWMDATAVTNGQVKGVQYAATTGVNALAVIVNPQLFEAAGVALPDQKSWTWDDFARISAEITAKSPAGTYGSSGTLTHDSLDCWARQRGESLYTAEGGLGLTVDTVASLLTLSKQMVDQKGAPPATVITEKADVPNEQTLMGTNKAAMMLTWSNGATALSKASGTELQLFDLPGESPKPGLWLQSSQFYAISAKSKHPEAAAKLINYLLNTTEAGTIVRTDRGVPANATVRTAITPELPAAGKAEVAYVDYQSKKALQQSIIGPAGSTAVADITKRALTDVVFGRATPQDAAKKWFSESEQAIR